MPREEGALRVDLRADVLRDAEHDSADQRSPERADAPDDDCLEGEDQLLRPAYGWKDERMPRNAPASAAVATAMPAASA